VILGCSGAKAKEQDGEERVDNKGAAACCGGFGGLVQRISSQPQHVRPQTPYGGRPEFLGASPRFIFELLSAVVYERDSAAGGGWDFSILALSAPRRVVRRVNWQRQHVRQQTRYGRRLVLCVAYCESHFCGPTSRGC